MTEGDLTCYNKHCPEDSNFDEVCCKAGVSKAKYCPDWKGLCD